MFVPDNGGFLCLPVSLFLHNVDKHLARLQLFHRSAGHCVNLGVLLQIILQQDGATVRKTCAQLGRHFHNGHGQIPQIQIFRHFNARKAAAHDYAFSERPPAIGQNIRAGHCQLSAGNRQLPGFSTHRDDQMVRTDLLQQFRRHRAIHPEFHPRLCRLVHQPFHTGAKVLFVRAHTRQQELSTHVGLFFADDDPMTPLCQGPGSLQAAHAAAGHQYGFRLLCGTKNHFPLPAHTGITHAGNMLCVRLMICL